MKKLFIIISIMAFTAQLNFAQEDKYIWLEEVENPKELEWVEQWNEK